jgi:predicted short-subunit dehydrogenase-like oxidoreductase (DUF2520 family)
MLELGFIGAGTVATALAVRLSERGYRVAAVASRSRGSAEKLASRVGQVEVCDAMGDVARKAELVFITTPDDVIASVAEQVDWPSQIRVLHCSGAHSLDLLKPAIEKGAVAGAFHPLQTFASVDHAVDSIPGSTFGVEAEEPLLSDLMQMGAALEGRCVVLRGSDKVLYHAAAVLACNYMVTLTKLATDLWQSFGVSAAEATEALLPLIQGTVDNLENVGLPDCLTGPVARGDLGTIRKHLLALEARSPELLSVYRELGRQTLPIALAKGSVGEQRAREVEEVLASPPRPARPNVG